METNNESSGGLPSTIATSRTSRRRKMSKVAAVAAGSVFFAMGWLMVIHPDEEGGISAGIGEEAEAQPACRRSNGPFHWSCNGPLPNRYCTQILEPSDPNTWQDNYFCTNMNLLMRWSYNGPIYGQACTQIYEYADPHTWQDNYLCVPPTSEYHFIWSSAGALPGLRCVQWREPSDPDTWNDNYLCAVRARY